jgi:hypothetical protein
VAFSYTILDLLQLIWEICAVCGLLPHNPKTIQIKKGKLLPSHRYNRIPLLPSEPGGLTGASRERLTRRKNTISFTKNQKQSQLNLPIINFKFSDRLWIHKKQKTLTKYIVRVYLQNRRRHTLPEFSPSTICAIGLNFSVRNGKRWSPMLKTP